MFRTFTWSVGWRIALLVLGSVGAFYAFFIEKRVLLAALGAVVVIMIGVNLHRFVNDTNRRLTRFLESVRYSDFAVRFSNRAEKGAIFEELDQNFNEVLEAFRQTRAEKEANLLFLNTLVQNLSTGLLAFDGRENLLLSNTAAFQLLGIYRLNNLAELPAAHKPLRDFVGQLKKKEKLLYQPETGRQIAVQGVRLDLQGRQIRLFTLQNIHPELQQKELDAWRNLTRVLRHEIMNSVTPIVSVIETMREIVKNDFSTTDSRTQDARADLEEALEIVAARSRGLVKFVDAYRSFSNVPEPKKVEISVEKLIDSIVQLVGPDFKKAGILLEKNVVLPDMKLMADPEQLEMVLLNLLKNARQSFGPTSFSSEKTVKISAGLDGKNRPFMEVSDNGRGIEPELLDEIFIPFFTTKPDGTGVGLSISKQIMQLHGGDISVRSEAGRGTVFVLFL